MNRTKKILFSSVGLLLFCGAVLLFAVLFSYFGIDPVDVYCGPRPIYGPDIIGYKEATAHLQFNKCEDTINSIRNYLFWASFFLSLISAVILSLKSKLFRYKFIKSSVIFWLIGGFIIFSETNRSSGGFFDIDFTLILIYLISLIYSIWLTIYTCVSYRKLKKVEQTPKK